MIKRLGLSIARRVVEVRARLTKRNFLAVFNYHQVSPSFNPKYQLPSTWTSLAHFEAQLLKIKSNFKVVHLPDALRKLKDGSLRGPCAAITLDDGDITLQQYVTPLLMRHQIPAMYFINSGYWGKQRTYWVYLVPYLMNNDEPAKRAAGGKTLMEQFAVLRNTNDPAVYAKTREEVEAHMHLVESSERLFVTKDFLATLDPALFAVGLHGHEHQRFSMMPESWQRQSIERNIEQLADLSSYRPIFAVPFGRRHDWDESVVSLCRERNIDVTFADGGINVPGDKYCERIPADGKNVMAVFRKNFVGW